MHRVGLVAALVCGLLSAAVSSAADIWVSPAGNDGWAGTPARPVRSLAKAAELAVPGTTVLLMSGVWRERLVVKHSGTASAPVIFRSAPGATPVIDGSGIRLTQVAGLVHLENLAWVTVAGISVRNAGPGETAAGILARQCRQIAITGCRTAVTVSSGIGVWFSKAVVVSGNDVTDACREGSQECITVAGCTGFEIAYNVVHDCTGGKRGGEGIDAKHGSAGRIHHNHVHHTRRLGIYVDAWDVEMRDIEVWANIVHDTQSNGYALAAENNGALIGVRFHDNMAYRNAHAGLTFADWGEQTPRHGLSDIVVERNTFVENGVSGWGGGIRLANAEAEGVVIRDNLLANNRGGQILVDRRPRSAVIDRNFVTGPGTAEHETFGERPVRGVPVYAITPTGVTQAPGSPGEGFGAR